MYKKILVEMSWSECMKLLGNIDNKNLHFIHKQLGIAK